jgi:hypothetical protein
MAAKAAVAGIYPGGLHADPPTSEMQEMMLAQRALSQARGRLQALRRQYQSLRTP